MATHNTSALLSFAVPRADDVLPKQADNSNNAGEFVDIWLRAFLARFKNWPFTLTGSRPGTPAMWHIHRDTAPTINSDGTSAAADYVMWNGSAWVDLTFDVLSRAISANGAYVHTQSVAATTWTVNHNLGFKPQITVTDTSNNVIGSPDIVHTNLNTATIVFAGALAGEARCE